MQIGIAGGAIARFDMHTSANDIVSEDYDIGFPVSLRSGRFSARLRAYHKSSHIGDEYQLNNPSFTRFDLTYEAVEGIIAGSFRSLRVYAGGDYIYHNVTTDIDPGTVRGGADFIAPGSFSIGSLDARFIAGAELKSTRDLPGRLQRAQSRGSSSRAPAVAHHRCRSCSRCSPAHPMPGSFTGPARVISA